jgi:hypothetical protein
MPDDHSEVVPLLPIPNRTVKRLRANDSADSRVKVGHRQAITPKIAQPEGWAIFFSGSQWIQSAICRPVMPMRYRISDRIGCE